jgi:hypothetical protein
MVAEFIRIPYRLNIHRRDFACGILLKEWWNSRVRVEDTQ